ncbi:MAG: hypothetical protein PVF74_03280 [Anaerolineales bacterium]|jgi:hypothetical protein
MDKNTNHNTDSIPEELNLFGEPRTIPAKWDVSSIMDVPKVSDNGRPKEVHDSQPSADSDDDQRSHIEGTGFFDDWYLGTYLDLDMEDNPNRRFWCAY